MNYLLLLLALLLAALPATAQNSLIGTQPKALPAAQANLDTAAALHRLFLAKRHTYRNVALGTIIAAGTVMVIVASAPDTESRGGGAGFNPGAIGSSDDKGLAVLGIGIISVPVLLVETLFCAGWSHKKEHRALEAWQQHQLSAFYYRKLKPKYFQ